MEDIRTESGMPIGDTVRKLRFYRSGVDLESGFFRNFKKVYRCRKMIGVLPLLLRRFCGSLEFFLQLAGSLTARIFIASVNAKVFRNKGLIRLKMQYNQWRCHSL